MKCLVILVFIGLFAFTLADDDKEKAEKVCFEKFGITKADMEGEFETYESVPENVKCAFKCLLGEIGMWPEGGIEQVKAMVMMFNIISDNESLKGQVGIFKTCSDDIPNDMDSCKAAYLYSKCLSKHGGEM